MGKICKDAAFTPRRKNRKEDWPLGSGVLSSADRAAFMGPPDSGTPEAVSLQSRWTKRIFKTDTGVSELVSKPGKQALVIANYRRPAPGSQPDCLHPAYVSSVKRAPTKAPVRIPQTLTEQTGPQFIPAEV